MRKIIAISGLLLLSSFGYSQSLQVIDTQPSVNVGLGDIVKTPIKIKNTSDKTIHILVQRERNEVGSSQSSFFCWEGDCTEPEMESMIASRAIKPGEILETFVNVLETGLEETLSSIEYTFYDRDNPADRTTFQLSYSVKDQNLEGFLFSSNKIQAGDIYPNPVGEMAYIDYQIFDEDTEAKIVFHNVLGSSISEEVLNPIEQVLKVNTLEFKPGVYFYTLYVDNVGKVTKKLVVK